LAGTPALHDARTGNRPLRQSALNDPARPGAVCPDPETGPGTLPTASATPENHPVRLRQPSPPALRHVPEPHTSGPALRRHLLAPFKSRSRTGLPQPLKPK
jgi:hypothetical protein